MYIYIYTYIHIHNIHIKSSDIRMNNRYSPAGLRTTSPARVSRVGTWELFPCPGFVAILTNRRGNTCGSYSCYKRLAKSTILCLSLWKSL